MAKADITAQRLRELLHYDPETGVFTWRVRRGGGAVAGGICGSPNSGGYIQIKIDRVLRKAHRLAWLYVHGAWPKADIDHINGVRDDNRLTNLRDVPESTNAQNLLRARKDSGAGLAGARKNRDSGWAARIRVGGKERHLGIFATPEEAHAAYIEAKRRLHTGCTI